MPVLHLLPSNLYSPFLQPLEKRAMAFGGLLSSTFYCFFLTLFGLVSLSLQHSAHSHGVGFLNNLHGCKKGERVEGIHRLKEYLQHFGYLSSVQIHSETKDGDEFDDFLESAIKTYQTNYNLQATGTLDDRTLAQMSKPRCGVADIVDGKTLMRSGKERNQHRKVSNHFQTVSHYAFFEGSPKWSKSHLSYTCLPGTPSEAISPVTRAFTTWAANTHFTFSQVSSTQTADITISFESGDHGDGHPFDGVGGVLAHAFSPPGGRLHYDAVEPWADGAVPNSYDLETVALHEIGHLLGLHHSSVEGAIMWPSIAGGATKGLHADDVAGIRALYSTTS